MLLALIAPGPIYVASAEEDLWADPRGEFLSLYFAGDAYKLCNYEGIQEIPKINESVTGGKMGYHIRMGKHDITKYDWHRFMDFADNQFGIR